MADLLIQGMKMPENRYRTVEITFDQDGYPMAIADGGDVYSVVPISDHGRCIDADELERKGADIYQDIVHCGYVEETIWGFSREMIENADTIIPASHGKKGEE